MTLHAFTRKYSYITLKAQIRAIFLRSPLLEANGCATQQRNQSNHHSWRSYCKHLTVQNPHLPPSLDLSSIHAPFYRTVIVASLQNAVCGFFRDSEFALFMDGFYFYIRMTSARHIIADFVLENGCFWLGGALEGFWENKFSFISGSRRCYWDRRRKKCEDTSTSAACFLQTIRKNSQILPKPESPSRVNELKKTQSCEWLLPPFPPMVTCLRGQEAT